MSQLKFKVLVGVAILILIWIVFSSASSETQLINRVEETNKINKKQEELIDSKQVSQEKVDLDSLVKDSIVNSFKKNTLSQKEEVELESKKVEELTEKILIGIDVFEDGENKFEEAMSVDNNITTPDVKDNVNTDIVGSIVERTRKAPIDYNVNYRKATFVEVLSGNEIVASIDGIAKVVKLIGIDDEYNSYKALNSILSGIDTIYLEFDVKRYDNNDKALAYIWLTEPNREKRENMINGMLIKSGFAKADTSPPNISYITYFSKLEREANK